MRQFEALVDRAELRRDDAVFCAGIGAAATYNVWREKGSQPVTANDFLPERRPDLTEDELAEEAAAFFEKLAKNAQVKQKAN